MFTKAASQFNDLLDEIRAAGTYKDEWVITSQQAADIQVADGSHVLNFCANNYLGLANHPDLIAAAKEGVEKYGFGMASVRFICGTLDVHKELEQRIANFFQTDDTILYAACFDANAGLFETILDKDSAIISDQLNHASIIDGVRLCKAERHRYPNSDMSALEEILQKTQSANRRMIATDGVFSMDGYIAKLDEICDLADKYDAMVMVDDCHATGFMGKTGRGAVEYRDCLGRVDVITSTLGKALGGASGGFTTGRKEIVELLRQRSRPYLFSNTLAPMIAYTSLTVLDMLEDVESGNALRGKLRDNTAYFRSRMTEAGFDIKEGTHPIVPVMLYDAQLASDFAKDMLAEGIYCVGFSFPVVPRGEARIRVQMSAAHDRSHLDQAVDAFIKVGSARDVV
jgi:glycine C-acetyltransferase